VRIEYDAEVDAAYIYLSEIGAGDVATTVPGAPGSEALMVNLDFDRDGRLVGIEVMDASTKLPPEFLARFGNRRVEPAE
jgi:uncharacterized protein YuzE